MTRRVEAVDKGQFTPPMHDVQFDLREFEKDIDGYNHKLEGALS